MHPLRARSRRLERRDHLVREQILPPKIGLRFSAEIDVWDFAEMYTLQAVIRNHGTSAQKQRLKEEILAGRWCTEIMLADG